MKIFIKQVFIVFFLLSTMLEGQERIGGKIIGTVYDVKLDTPIEYANIVLHNQPDSSQVTGTITDQNGYFQLNHIQPGIYYLEAHFLGYKVKRINNIELKPPSINVNLGQIELEQGALSAEVVEVEGERVPIAYQLDKKVINVDRLSTTVSGNAVEVLENIPSITVDIEGNVSLRGSNNFTLLIDGRPSVLEPSDALQQLPASSIENVEIITNPSVKYDPEGTSGIINIILKKNQQLGISGMANLNGGLRNKYGGDALIDYQNSRYHATVSIDYNNRFYGGEGREKNMTMQEGRISLISSQGTSSRDRTSVGVRGELVLKLNQANTLNFGGRYGNRSSQRYYESDLEQWLEMEQQHSFYSNITESERSGAYYSLFSSYLHRFANKGHEIYTELYYRGRDGDEITSNKLLDDQYVQTSGQKSTEAGPSNDLRFKVEYSHPMGGENRFEAGYLGELDRSKERTGLYEYDPVLGYDVFFEQYSNNTLYYKNIQALYALYGGKWKQFGYQGGLRGEYTYRTIEFDRVAELFTIDRWDYFPTIHLSYQFNGGEQFMASYSRRIDRPRGWELEPFETWTDAYNVRAGNPALRPEYIDSYEGGIQTYVGKNLFSSEIYYRVTHNKIERVRSVYDDNVTLHTVENVGTDYALGSEMLFNMEVLKNWNSILTGNLYKYRIDGMLSGESFSRESFNWRSRMSNTFKLGRFTQVQLDGIYNSPSVSAQGRREGFFMINGAVKRELLNRRLSITLQIRDLFSTAKHEYTAEGPDFYTHRYRTRESPMVMLNIRFIFNNYKPEPQQDTDEFGEEEDES
jgi:outer membrane receptor protein involved in Fe transport